MTWIDAITILAVVVVLSIVMQFAIKQMSASNERLMEHWDRVANDYINHLKRESAIYRRQVEKEVGTDTEAEEIEKEL